MVDKVVFWGLCLILALVPLPYGGNEEWAIFAFEAAVLALLALYVVGRAAGGKREDEDAVAGARERAVPLWVKALFAVFFAVSAAQILPLPAGVLGAVSPATQRFYQGLAGSGLTDLQGHAWNTIAFAPNLALYELLKIVCYGIFGFLIMRTARTRARVKVLVFVVVLSGVFQAVYGLGELWSGTGRIFGWKNRWGQGSAFGTFVNRDHYSAFLEMIFPLALGYLLARADFFAMKKGLTLREKFLWFGQERFQKSFVAGLLAAVVGVGLLFSRSLSGIIIFSVSLVLMSTLLSLADGKRRGGGGRGREEHVEPGGREERADGRGDRARRSRRSVRTVALAVVFAVVLIGVQPILQRLTRKDFTLEKGRAVYYRNTVEMIKAYAGAGVGLGSFSYSYPRFEKEYEKGLLDHAHNDYLEALAESGVAGGGALAAGAVALLALLAVRWARRRDSLVRGVGVGCIVGVLAMLIHSGADFSLRMPANAAYFVTLYALGLSVVGLGRAQTHAASALEPGGGSSRRRTKTASIVLGALLLAGIGGLMVAAVKQNMAYRYLDKYEAERAALAREGKSLVSGFERLEGLLVKGVGWSKNPVIYGELARLYTERAIVENEEGLPGPGGTKADTRVVEARTEGWAGDWQEQRDAALDKARGALKNLIEANPADARGYFEMGKVMMLYNYPLLTYAEQGRQYMRKALELKRHNIVLNVNVIFTHLAQWEGMGDAERAWVMRWLATVWAGVEVNAKAFWPELRRRWKSAGGDLEGLRAILR